MNISFLQNPGHLGPEAEVDSHAPVSASVFAKLDAPHPLLAFLNTDLFLSHTRLVVSLTTVAPYDGPPVSLSGRPFPSRNW